MAVRTQDNSLLTYDEWKLKRLETIGASIFGILVYGSKWTSNLELFYQYIGAKSNDVENIRMFLGTETEDITAKCWGYYGGTEQSVVENARKGNLIKQCEKTNLTYFNDDYSYLSCTPDRKILPYGKYEGRGNGSLELKNTQSFVLNSYETGLPTDNVIQLCGQLMITGWDYGELFYFIDNSKFQCHELERKDMGNIEEVILTHTTDFFERVLAARPLYNQLFDAQRNFNQRLVGELQNEISALEPPVQNTIGYRDFLTERYKDKMADIGIVKGDEIQLQVAQKHKQLAKEVDKIEADKLKLEIELKHIIGDNNTLDFGKNGKVTWIENKNGKRSFLNKTK